MRQGYIAIICVLLLLLNGKKTLAQHFKGGLYAGVTTSQIDGDGLAGFDLAGFHAGALTYINWGQKGKLQLEIAFIQKGAREKDSDSSIFYKARLNYIEIPLLYAYRWNDLSLEIGPGLDILVTSYEEDIFGERTGTDFSRFNLTGIFGVNYHFSRKFYLNLRSNISITPIADIPARRGRFGLELGGPGPRNIVLSCALVYNFLRD